MRFELFIALRYLLARRRQAFISVISLISTLGVAVGVMALVIALALMTGLQAGAARPHPGVDRTYLRLEGWAAFEDYRADVERLSRRGRGGRRGAQSSPTSA